MNATSWKSQDDRPYILLMEEILHLVNTVGTCICKGLIHRFLVFRTFYDASKVVQQSQNVHFWILTNNVFNSINLEPTHTQSHACIYIFYKYLLVVKCAWWYILIVSTYWYYHWIFWNRSQQIIRTAYVNKCFQNELNIARYDFSISDSTFDSAFPFAYMRYSRY